MKKYKRKIFKNHEIKKRIKKHREICSERKFHWKRVPAKHPEYEKSYGGRLHTNRNFEATKGLVSLNNFSFQEDE